MRVPILYGKIQFLAESSVDSLLKNVLDSKSNKETSNQFKKFKADVFQVRYPTCVDDVARVLCDISEKRIIHSQSNIKGIAQFSAKTKMTKYEMCLTFSSSLGIDGDELFVPDSPVSGQTEIDRPENCQLSTKALENWGINVSCIDFNEWWSTHIKNNSYII
ncbi:Methionine adenosyltransferase 2 subunit beta [Smittium culicis]|uniref:Methionine adenosyltransferase 2 subunit beta n=1 Tax=Smittium culicis TaxID=133412 RepID=A0A1R1YNR7_9FUNG|nr:Methionine adenosyltransferase 2 subunit beta [Smittium culicis]